ncbi:MAG: SAM-dependent chlorinase/fluorinase [bacterium]
MAGKESLVTLTTDFGSRDPYVGIVKGVILGLCPDARIIDLTHHIPAQNINYALWTLKDSVHYFPEGTVHMAVVDPGVGGSRRPIALRSGGQILVGPDNGIFSAFIPADEIVVCNRPEFFLPKVSRTFHARDIFAPVAARLACGWALSDLGDPITDPMEIPVHEARPEEGSILGKVVQVDHFGNLITNIPADMVPERSKVTVSVRNRKVAGLSECYSAAERGTLTCLIGSSGRLEIAVPQGAAASVLAAGVGDEVEVEFD